MPSRAELPGRQPRALEQRPRLGHDHAQRRVGGVRRSARRRAPCRSRPVARAPALQMVMTRAPRPSSAAPWAPMRLAARHLVGVDAPAPRRQGRGQLRAPGRGARRPGAPGHRRAQARLTAVGRAAPQRGGRGRRSRPACRRGRPGRPGRAASGHAHRARDADRRGAADRERADRVDHLRPGRADERRLLAGQAGLVEHLDRVAGQADDLLRAPALTCPGPRRRGSRAARR